MSLDNKIKVAIADDHRSILHGLTLTVNYSTEYAVVVDTATSLGNCMSMLQHSTPDVLLLNMGFPDGNSIDWLPAMKEICPTVKILMFTGCDEAAVINRALMSGADGFISKTSSAEELLKGILIAAEGEEFLCSGALEILKRNNDPEHPKLTKRELQILKLITDGYTLKEIADKLFLSFETVRSYSKYIRLKMGVDNTALMVKKAIKQRLV